MLNWEKVYGNTCGNILNERKCMVTHWLMRVIIRWSYGDALHYGPTVVVEFGNVWHHIGLNNLGKIL